MPPLNLEGTTENCTVLALVPEEIPNPTASNPIIGVIAAPSPGLVISSIYKHVILSCNI